MENIKRVFEALGKRNEDEYWPSMDGESSEFLEAERDGEISNMLVSGEIKAKRGFEPLGKREIQLNSFKRRGFEPLGRRRK